MYDRGVIMTEEERYTIIDWVSKNYFSMRVLPFTRLEYDINIEDNTLPISIFRIKNRILHKEKLHTYITEPISRDIILVQPQNGITPPHRDSSLGDYIHIRYNVFVLIPEGTSKTVYGGKEIDTVEGHYAMCRSGLDYHSIGQNGSEIPRISLSFGFLVPKYDLHDYEIKNNPPKVVFKKGIYYTVGKVYGSAWPSALSTMNFISQFTRRLGLQWWKGETGRLLSS